MLTAVTVLLVVVPAIAWGSSGSSGSADSSSSSGGEARSERNSKTYADSTGEDAAAPDITSTVVSNDDPGLITFQIAVANRPALTADMLFDIFVDSDKKASTGDTKSFGAEYVIELQPGSVNLFRWNGTTFAAAPSQTSLTFAYAATGATIRVHARDLGKTKGFNFVIDAASGITVDASGNSNFTNAHDDLSPDVGHGTFAYEVLTKLALKVVAFTTSPLPARAGRTFSAGLAATQNDTGGAVEQGTVTCSARIAGKEVVARANRVVNGVAVCVWPIPRAARGKMIRGSVVLAVRGVQVTRSFSARIG